MFYTIYKVTNLINGKFYIGKHQTKNPNDAYYGSGKALRNAIKLHGKHNFSKEVLHIFETEDEMNAKERELITEEFVARPDTYNLGVGGEGGPHFKGKIFTEEHRKKISNANKGRKHTEEARENMRLSFIGKKLSEKTKEKIRLSAIGRKHSEETKQKIREKRKHQTFSDETKEKMKRSALRRHSVP